MNENFNVYDLKNVKFRVRKIIIPIVIIIVIISLIIAMNIYLNIIELNEIGQFSGIYLKNLFTQIAFFGVSAVFIFIVLLIASILVRKNITKYYQEHSLPKRKINIIIAPLVFAIIGAFMSKEALYYETLGNKVHCFLCPHNCKILENHKGLCNVRKAMKDEDGKLKLYSLNYEAVTSIAIDPIEKKPLYRFHPGSYVLSVGSFGCNFKCSFCQNYSISQQVPEYKRVSSYELLDILNSKENCIGIAFTYNEPSIWYEYVLECSKLIKEKLPTKKVVLVSNGFITDVPLNELLPYIDAMNIDLKGDDEYYKRLCGGNLKPVLDTIKRTYDAGVHIEITTLLVEGENTSLETVQLIGDFLSNLDKNIPIHLSRYFPNYKLTTPPTNLEDIKRAYWYLKKRLNFVFLGNLSSEELKYIGSETSHLPR